MAAGGSGNPEVKFRESGASSAGETLSALRPGTWNRDHGATAGELIAVIGGESTGKSTLAASLTDDLPGLLVPETLRSWVMQCGRVPRADEQREVMREHAAAELRALDAIGAVPKAGAGAHERVADGGEGVTSPTPPEKAPPWCVVSDGGTLMTAVYSLLYYDDDSLVAEALQLSRRARLIVWCSADFEWVADAGQRDGPHMRDAAQEIIGEVLAASGLPWLPVAGPPRSRVRQVRGRLAVGA